MAARCQPSEVGPRRGRPREPEVERRRRILAAVREMGGATSGNAVLVRITMGNDPFKASMRAMLAEGVLVRIDGLITAGTQSEY
jgi:hypothetical protein